MKWQRTGKVEIKLANSGLLTKHVTVAKECKGNLIIKK